MPFEKGNKLGQKFSKGVSGNAGGAPRKPMLRGSTKAISAMLGIVRDVLEEDDVLEAFEVGFRDAMLKEPLKTWRTIVVPLTPRETALQVSHAINGTLKDMTVTQLRSIAGMEDSEPIDITEEVGCGPNDKQG